MVKQFIMAIDLGGTNLKCALLDNRLEIRAKTSFSTKSFDNRLKLISGIVDCVNSFIDSLLENSVLQGGDEGSLSINPGKPRAKVRGGRRLIVKQGLAKAAVLGVGIGVPGPVDTFKGVVHFLPNIAGWKEVGLKKILEQKIKLPVFIDNDAKLMTLAEYMAGSAKGYSNVLCLTLGTGVGGGLIIGGSLYRGKDNAAGEIGHFPLNEKGPVCGCGAQACLEAYIGNNRIIKDARRLFGSGITLERISQMAGDNDSKAIEFWSGIGKKLGLALSGVVNLLNLDAIVIGGGVSYAGKALFASIKQTILQRAMSVHAKRVKIFKAKLGNDAGIIGAGYLVRERMGAMDKTAASLIRRDELPRETRQGRK